MILSWHTVVNMSKIHRLCIMFAFQQMLHGHVDLLLPSAWWCGAWWQRLQGITLFRWESQSITFTFGLASILALDPWNTLKHLERPGINTWHPHIAIPSTKTTCLACWDSLTGESPMSLSSHDFIRMDGSEELFFAAFAKCFRVSGGFPNRMLYDTVPSGYVKIAIENGHL